MWIPWRNKTGLAKAAAILATTLSVATVSCGLNWALAMANSTTQWALGFLVIAGYAELIVMVASVVGLLIVLVIWLVSKGHALTRKDSND
jgi:hypothetical protein